MKILIFTLEFPPMLGGAGTYSKELASGLCDLGHDVTVLTSTRGMDHRNLETYNYKVVRKRWSKNIWFLEWPFILKVFLKKNIFDLVIFANQGAIIIGNKIKYIPSPYLCTLHGSERYTFLAPTMSCKMKILVNKKKLEAFLSEAHKVICVSQNLLDDVKLLVDDHVKLERIPLGISNKFVMPTNKFEFDNNVINIVSTARFVKGKGHEKVLFGVKELLKKSTKQVRLTFIGNGVEEEHIKKLAYDLDLSDIVSFRGLLDRDIISQIYSDMDVFIMLSSFKETFGLVYLEAMFAGLPVIGSDLGAVGDLIKHGENGYLLEIEQQEPEKIADALMLAYNNRIRLGNNGLNISSMYTNLAMAKSHLKGL